MPRPFTNNKKGGVNMTYIALASFVGSMGSVRKNEIVVINDKAIAEDLMKAGYIEPIDKTVTVLKDDQEYRVIG